MSTKSIALLGIGAVLLAGCGRADPAEPTAGSPAPSASAEATGQLTGELTVWAMGNEGELLKDFAAPFEEANPELTITVTSIPWADAAQKISTAIAGGQTPDMTLVDLTLMPTYVASGGFLPVPDEAVDLSSFFPGARDAVTFDGAAYAVPWYVSSRIIFYRADLAAQAGVSCPADWDGYLEFASGLQSAGATYGAVVPFGQFNAWQQLLPFFWQAGGSVVTADGSEFALDSPAMVEALEYVNTFVTKGIATAEGPTATGQVEAEFVNGTYGAFVSGPWEALSLATASDEAWVEENVGVCAMPVGPAGNNDAYTGGGALAVFSGATNPQAAFAFAAWLADPQVQVDWYVASADLPAVAAAWEDPAMQDDELIAVFGAQLENVQGAPPVPTWSEVGAMIDGEIEKVVRGVTTPADAAATMQREAASIGLD